MQSACYQFNQLHDKPENLVVRLVDFERFEEQTEIFFKVYEVVVDIFYSKTDFGRLAKLLQQHAQGLGLYFIFFLVELLITSVEYF